MGKEETKNHMGSSIAPRQSLLIQAKQIIEAPTAGNGGLSGCRGCLAWAGFFALLRLLLQVVAVGACPCWQVTDTHY